MGFFGGSKPNKTVAVPPMAWTPNVNLAVARPLVLQLINETHRGRPLENVEALALFGRFQGEDGRYPRGSSSLCRLHERSFVRDQRASKPSLVVAGGKCPEHVRHRRRPVCQAHDVWAGAWKKSEYERFRIFLTRAMLTVGSVPRAVLDELKHLGAVSLPRLPRDLILLGMTNMSRPDSLPRWRTSC